MNTNWKFPLLILVAFFAVNTATAQKRTKKPEDIDKKKTQTITIVRSGDEKITVEVDGDKVTVNGKPLEEYKGDVNITTGDADFHRMVPGRLRAMKVPTAPMAIAGMDAEKFITWNSNKAVLGVSTENVEGGARVTEVREGSAAEKAGLKTGDIITRVNETNISDADDLPATIGKLNPEDKITVTYKREGKEQTTTATLQKNTHSFDHAFALTDNFEHFDFDHSMGQGKAFGFSRKPRLGLQVEDLQDGSGVKVLDVNAETPAAKAGIQKDDIISSFNGKEIKGVEELKTAMKEIKEGDTAKVTLQRSGTTQNIDIKFPKAVKKASL